MPATPFLPGEPAPWFTARTHANPKYHIDTVAGRYVVLCFFESAADPRSQRVLADIMIHRHRFDDDNVCFFGVSTDPDDEQQTRVKDVIPGIRYFWDFEQEVSRQYGVIRPPSQPGIGATCHRLTFVLDLRLRVLAVLSFDEEPEAHVPLLLRLLDRLPPIGPPTLAAPQAPILVVPYIFEPELCQRLIDLYEQYGGRESGFMRDAGGKTVGIVDYGHKRRLDYDIEDESVRKACMVRIHDRLAPEIHKAFQFHATRMERYIVACYDAEWGGHFSAHRDNTTRGTAHRRFAVSLMLNTGEYAGGYLRFPEFGPQLYTAPPGGAVVFSCSLLHEATPVTRGRRYVFLPFLYDDEAARIRQQNERFLAGTVSGPQTDTSPPGVV
ncbi:MAG: redoxin domain-containing protein [Planctomycetes bacterium]|nr:redoxin domain-containing protein [Planctomycetota bacterium]